MRLSEKDYEVLVSLIIKLKECIVQAKLTSSRTKEIEQKAKIDIIRMQADGFLLNVITGLANDLTELFAFAYELRKQDAADLYTEDLLNGPVKPAILVTIIANNVWLSKSKKMGLKRDDAYRFVISHCEYRYNLCYSQ